MIFLKKNIVKNTLTLSTGTAFASLIPILLQPVFRRIYSPEDFGVFAVYISITGIIVVISSLKYELAVILPKNDNEAANVTFLSLFIAASFNICVILILVLAHKTILGLFKFPVEYKMWFYFIPLSAFLFSSFNVLNYWLVRKRSFRASASCKAIRRGVEGTVQVIAGRLGMTGAGLYLGDLVGQTANLFSGLFLAVRSGLTLKDYSNPVMKKMLIRHKDLSLYNTLPAFFNTLTLAMPIFLVNRFYSNATTGQLDLARLILFIPLVFIAEPLAQVFYQYAAEKSLLKQTILPKVCKMFFILSFLTIVGIIVLQVWSVDLFFFVFGNNWLTAAGFSTILVYSVSLRFITDPFRFIFAAQEKIWILSLWQVLYFFSILSLFLMKNLEIKQFLTIFVLLETSCYLVLLFLIFYTLIRYEKQL